MPVAVNCRLVFAAIDEFAGVTEIDIRGPLELDVYVRDGPCAPHPNNMVLKANIKKIKNACLI